MALHPDPDQFSYYSGYDSFQQVIGSFSGTVAVSGNVAAAPPNNFAVFTAGITVPLTNYSTQAYMQSSAVNTGRKYLVENLQIENLVRAGSSNYNLEINLKEAPGTVTVEAAVNNPTGGVLTLVTENLVFDIKVFVTPFV